MTLHCSSRCLWILGTIHVCALPLMAANWRCMHAGIGVFSSEVDCQEWKLLYYILSIALHQKISSPPFVSPHGKTFMSPQAVECMLGKKLVYSYAIVLHVSSFHVLPWYMYLDNGSTWKPLTCNNIAYQYTSFFPSIHSTACEDMKVLPWGDTKGGSVTIR